jgi:coenzyme F420 hydrogenase subunit beta
VRFGRVSAAARGEYFEQGGLEMNVYGSGELKADVLLKDLCIGCGACISLCPYFKSYNGKTAMLFPCTQPQGRCFAYCPKVEVDLDGVSKTVFGTEYKADPIGQYRSVKTAKAGGKVKGGNFQCGGTVSALITYALEKKKIDAAVLTDREGVMPVPRLVTDSAEVLKCASSKYTAAPTLSALNVAVDQG